MAVWFQIPNLHASCVTSLGYNIIASRCIYTLVLFVESGNRMRLHLPLVIMEEKSTFEAPFHLKFSIFKFCISFENLLALQMLIFRPESRNNS